MSNAEQLMRRLEPIFGSEEIEVDHAVIERITAALDPITSDDLIVEMRGDQRFTASYEGRSAAIEAWSEWLEVFEQLRFEIESVEEAGDNVLTLVRQVGVTRHGGVEIEQPSAAVWKFRDGRLVRLEFHLDQDAARTSAYSSASSE